MNNEKVIEDITKRHKQLDKKPMSSLAPKAFRHAHKDRGVLLDIIAQQAETIGLCMQVIR